MVETNDVLASTDPGVLRATEHMRSYIEERVGTGPGTLNFGKHRRGNLLKAMMSCLGRGMDPQEVKQAAHLYNRAYFSSPLTDRVMERIFHWCMEKKAPAPDADKAGPGPFAHARIAKMRHEIERWVCWDRRLCSGAGKLLLSVYAHAQRVGKDTLHLSCRDAAELSGMSFNCASQRLNELVVCGYLDRVETSKLDRAHVYRLVVPRWSIPREHLMTYPEEVAAALLPPPCPEREETDRPLDAHARKGSGGDSNVSKGLAPLCYAADEFRHNGGKLGVILHPQRAGWIMLNLIRKVRTLPANGRILGEKLGVNYKTALRAIRRLAAEGLVSEIRNENGKVVTYQYADHRPAGGHTFVRRQVQRVKHAVDRVLHRCALRERFDKLVTLGMPKIFAEELRLFGFEPWVFDRMRHEGVLVM